MIEDTYLCPTCTDYPVTLECTPDTLLPEGVRHSKRKLSLVTPSDIKQIMCGLYERVYRCNHYHKTLSWACDSAKQKKSVCKTGNKTISTTTGLAGCGLMGCNGNALSKREGPG